MPPYRGTSTFVVPMGIVLRRVAAGRINASRWEVYAGYKVPKIGDWKDEDERYLGDVVNWTSPGDSGAGWSWQPKGGPQPEAFSSVGPVAEILGEIALYLRQEQVRKMNEAGDAILDYCHTHDGKCDSDYERRDHGTQ